MAGGEELVVSALEDSLEACVWSLAFDKELRLLFTRVDELEILVRDTGFKHRVDETGHVRAVHHALRQVESTVVQLVSSIRTAGNLSL